MKIVHIITRLILGGAQENTLITCEELAKRGHDVTLITGPAIGAEGELFTKASKEGYQVKVVDQMVREINPAKDFIAYHKIKKLLKQIKPDIVHTHSAKAGILGRYAADSLLGKFGKEDTPAIVHTNHGNSFGPYNSWLKNKLFISIEKTAAKRTDAFISVADAVAEEALAAKIGQPENYTTAYSAIEQQQYLREYSEQEISGFRRRFGISEQAVVLITIARLAELKGHEYIIESAKQLSEKFNNCVWLMVGDGNKADEIKDNIKLSSQRYNFIFTGLLSPDEIPLALHSSDILVHTSMREGLARVLPQAMLCDIPAISFDISGAREVVNQNTGRLIKPEDTNALTQACEELISSEELRVRLGKGGKEFIIEKFKPETMVDTIENVYNKLFEEKD